MQRDDTSSRAAYKPGADKLLGRVLAGRFELVELLTRGAMGKIYRTNQLDLGRECVIKVLDVRHIPDAGTEFTSRFFREASVAAKLTHPNVVTVFDYGRTEDDVYFIAMELLLGRSLEKAIRDELRLPWQRAVDIASQICRGLRVAHAVDVVHRDLKPANIFLVDTGDGDLAKIVDFGLAKLTRPAIEDEQITQIGAFMGSAKYACPEQIRGTDLDGRADLYALGIILYEMITGKVPYDGPNEASILVAHMNARPARFRDAAPGVVVPEELERVIFKMFAHRREDRFATAADALQALKSASGLSALLVTGNIPAPRLPLPDMTSSGMTPTPFAAIPAKAPSFALPRRSMLMGGGAAAALLVALGVALVRSSGNASSAALDDEGTGRIIVTITGAACRVAVDGVSQGASPIAPLAVQPGMHTVTCMRADGRVLATQVRVAAGETASARFAGE